MSSNAPDCDGGLPTARLRRIEDVRRLQQRRRRQALETPARQQQQQQWEEIQTPSQQPPSQGVAYNNHRHHVGGDDNNAIASTNHHPHHGGSDDNTAIIFTPRSATSSSTMSTRRALSAKRQNMMQRRIQMRRRNEDRERQQQNQSNQAQHFHEQPRPQRSTMAQKHGHQHSILKNAGDNPRTTGVGMYDHSSQRHYHQQDSPPEDQQPHHHSGQGHNMQQKKSYQRHPLQVHRQQHQQYYHLQSTTSRYGQQQPQQKRNQQLIQYSRTQSQTQPPPMAIPSPPTLQRRQQFPQITVHQNSQELLHGHNDPIVNQAVYDQAQLEQSGIIRNGNGDHAQTNRLKNSPYDSPSDEWHGSENLQVSNNHKQGHHHHQQRLPFKNQNDQQHHLPLNPQPLQPSRQLVGKRSYNDARHQQQQQHQQHYDMLKHRSMQVVNTRRNRFFQTNSQKAPQQQQQQNSHQKHQPQHKQPNQQQQQQYQDQNQPNWNEINEKYNDSNSQQHHQCHSASMQQHKHQQEEEQHQQMSYQAQTKNQPMPYLFPAEHIGNHTDQIKRKNIGNLASLIKRHNHQVSNQVAQRGVESGRRHQQQQESLQHPNNQRRQDYHRSIVRSNSTIVGEDSVASVSSQACQFEYGDSISPGRSNNLSSRASSALRVNQCTLSPQRSLAMPLVDEDGTAEGSVSVASLRKEWEGKQQQQQRSNSVPRGAMITQTSSSRALSNKHMENSPFGVWEERANRLALLRRREQRKEQKKNIEDRWMRQRQQNNAPPRNDGYQSGGTQGRGSTVRYHDGYQSEGTPRSRNRDYQQDDSGYHSEGQGQEVVYKGTLDSVDSAAITPQDARRRLWDTKERLRAVLPRTESFDNLGNIHNPWPHPGHGPKMGHDGNGSGNGSGSDVRPLSVLKGTCSPRNAGYSGSITPGRGLFKSKFVDAAARATQKRAAANSQTHKKQHQQMLNITEKDIEELHQQQQQQQLVKQKWGENNETQQDHHHRALQQKQKSYHQKDQVAASSHYTDSTAELTDITTPDGSYGSSNLRSASAAAGPRANNNINYAILRKVSPPPPKCANMPPIAEAPKMTTSVTSVAELIARINAVSRSNPEEALAAIDSIIKGEKDGGGGGMCGDGMCGGSIGGSGSGGGPPNSAHSGASRAVPQQSPNYNEPAATPVKDMPSFLPNRGNVALPPANAKRQQLPQQNVVRHLGKDFFQERYEKVLQSDSELVISRASLEEAVGNENDHGEVEDNEEVGSLLSSSEESTVSSMTDPTYQSLRSEQMHQKNTPSAKTDHLPRNHQPRPNQQQNHLPFKPLRSWNTLKREYYERKASSHTVKEEYKALANQTSSEDLGLDEFNPDDIDIEQLDSHPLPPPPPPQQQPQQPQSIIKSSTNEFTAGLGICGVDCHMPVNPLTSQSKNTETETEPQTPSALADSGWVLFNDAGGMEGRKKNTVLRHQQQEQARGNQVRKRWPFTSQGPPLRLNPSSDNGISNNSLDMPPLVSQHQGPTKHQSSDSNAVRKIFFKKSPERRQAMPGPRASTPEILMAVSNAFSNVDISLETAPPVKAFIDKSCSHPMVDNEIDDGTPLQYVRSLDLLEEQQAASLQTVSEAFSDVDINLKEEKVFNQQRKELEYLAKSWTASKSSDSSSSFIIDKKSMQAAPPKPNKVITTSSDTALSWVNEPQTSTTRAPTVNDNQKKRVEPTLRLKENKSLAQKIASLVKAYDD